MRGQRKMNLRIVLVAGLCALLCAPGVASAKRRSKAQKPAPVAVQPPPPSPLGGEDRPWAKGVSDGHREKALGLFLEGNALLKDSVFVQAAAKYREALTYWDHPAIHYNLVLALLNLDQPIELHEHLVKAMAYGPAPLDQDKFDQARAYKSLVEKQLAKVTITCAVDGATVRMDGRPLFTAPGTYEGLVRAGPHTIVASRQGYLTNEISRSLPPGEASTIELKLYLESDLTQYRRKWSAWGPWSVVAGGAAVALGGGFMHMTARDHFVTYDRGITDCGGCVPSAGQKSRLQTGNTLQGAAFAAYGVGGAALLAGAVLVYVNRLEPYRVDPNVQFVESVSVLPVLAPGEGGVMASIRF